ncbi:hypothetical protein LSH36_20g12025 [Paralvinella palmiformis]|uniref:C2H2-type domain-containing protein n=1 Tax=Paralvinella palmiformis TaxID=53620 RepID=A0AAD9NFI2_9ANNE|nr:hypothetical protein LSH36_20g12025 [Paralvinella palmiformis]
MEEIRVKTERPIFNSDDKRSEYVDDYHAYCLQHGYNTNDAGVAMEMQQRRSTLRKAFRRRSHDADDRGRYSEYVRSEPEHSTNCTTDSENGTTEEYEENKVIKSEPPDDDAEEQAGWDSIDDSCNHQELPGGDEDYYSEAGIHLLHSIKQEAELHDSYENPATSSGSCSQTAASASSYAEARRRRDARRAHLHKCTFDGCNKAFKSPRSLATHTQYHTMDRKYECTYEGCSRTFISRANLNMHLKSHLIKEYVCDFKNCGMRYKLPEHLEKHKLVHKPLDPLACPKCFKQFSTSQILKNHVQTCQSVDGMLPCQIKGCNRTFKKLKALLEHQTKPHGPFICDVDDCGREFQALKTLKTHIRITHRDGFRFVCQEPGCGRAFKVADSLRKHMISHSSERTCICSECGAAFKYKHSLQKHMAVHDSSMYKYHCPIEGCNMAYHTPSELRNHHERKHTDCNNWACDICGKEFKCRENYKCHVRTHSDKSSFKHICPEEGCGMKFRLKRYLRQHMVQHETPKGPFTCPLEGCGRVFWKNSAYERHIINHTFPVMCPVENCKRTYKNIPTLRRHVNRHIYRGDDAVFSHSCPFASCSVELKSMPQFKEHVSTRHMVYESHREVAVHGRKQREKFAVMRCFVSDCDGIFDGYHSWLLHLCSIHPDQFFKLMKIFWPRTSKNPFPQVKRKKPRHKTTICDMCGKVLCGISSLKRHIDYIHIGMRPFVCPVPGCGKAFKGRIALKIHSNVHTDQHNYKCKFPGCGKRYKNPNSLSTHKRTHYNIKRQRRVCPHEGCDKVYASDTAFRCHLNTHTNPGCNKCTFCGKTLADANSLARHVTMHTSTRTVVCMTCGKTFHSEYYLKLHKRYHVKKKKYGCTMDGCTAEFYYPCNLKNHLSTVHGIGSLDCDETDGDSNTTLMISDNTGSHIDRQEMLLGDFSVLSSGSREEDVFIKMEADEGNVV